MSQAKPQTVPNKIDPDLEKKLAVTLLFTRLSIGVVFLVWGFDKLFNTAHGLKVLEVFYGISAPTGIIIALGIFQLALVAAFILGLWKNAIYLLFLLMHLASTLVSFSRYLDPFNNLLFFAAWPMLAALLFLYVFRDYDTFSLGAKKK